MLVVFCFLFELVGVPMGFTSLIGSLVGVLIVLELVGVVLGSLLAVIEMVELLFDPDGGSPSAPPLLVPSVFISLIIIGTTTGSCSPGASFF